jgi:hypothetical protein
MEEGSRRARRQNFIETANTIGLCTGSAVFSTKIATFNINSDHAAAWIVLR